MPYAAPFLFLAVGVLIRLTPAAEMQVSDGRVRLADVADVPTASVGAIEIARIPAGATRTISRRQLANLVERAVPGARISGDLDGTVILHSARAPTAAAPQPYAPQGPAVERDQKLTLVSTAGSVVVERPVVAVQSATKADKRLFVQTEDGDIISAPLAAGKAR